jgi:hypothetical protein
VILSAEEKVAAEKLHALTTRLLFLKYEMENAKKLGIHAPRMAWFKKRRSLEQALDKMHSVLRQSEWKIPEELDSCGEGMRTHHEDFSKCAKGTHKHFQKYLEAATIEGAGSLTIEGAGSTAHAHREPVQVSTSNVHQSADTGKGRHQLGVKFHRAANTNAEGAESWFTWAFIVLLFTVAAISVVVPPLLMCGWSIAAVQRLLGLHSGKGKD